MNDTETRKHKALIDLIPAFALDILEPDEAEMIEGHLPSCETCQAELRAYRSVVNMLPLAAPETDPGPMLREQIMSRVRAITEVNQSRSPSWLKRQVERIEQSFVISYWQFAGALLLVAVLIASALMFFQSRTTIQTQYSLAEPSVSTNANGLIVVSDEGQNATLIVENLATLSSDQQYQLWFVEENGTRKSAGLFSVNEDGYQSLFIYSDQPFDSYVAFGITVEPIGGSEAPTGEPVLVSN